MKNKITCLLAGAALFGATANAEIVLAEGLSASGYIDIVSVDGDISGNNDRTTTTNEFELGLSFTPAESAYSAVAEISYDGTAANFETVTVSYQYSDALSFTAGHILSYQGLESFDAPNNYFVSYAGINGTALYSAGYADGVSADYSAGDIAFGVWAGDQPASDDLDLEYFLGYTGIENLSLGVAIADNNDSSKTVNLMAKFEYDAFTLMVESVDHEDFVDGADLLGAEIVSATAAYAMGDTTFAVRFADGDYITNDVGADYTKVSYSVFQALSDNASIGVEYSDQEVEGADDTDEFAVELLYVF
jgi:hypothetical protein